MIARFSAYSGAIAALLAFSTGCDDTPDPGSRVVTTRVLAEQVDTPFAAPGATPHVSSLSFDPQGRALTWAWASCTNPDSTSLESCVARASGNTGVLTRDQLLAFGSGVDTVDVPIPADALSSLPAAAQPSAAVGVLSAACPGDLSIERNSEGLPFRCTETGSGRELGLDEFVVGVKRIPVREHDMNQNPVIAQVLFDGTDWPEDEVKQVSACNKNGNVYLDCGKQYQHQLALQVTHESFESGTDEFGRSFSEELVIQYYATGGIYENDTRIAGNAQTGFVARAQDLGTDLTVWMVARDDRGGVTWTTRKLQVR